MTAKTKQAESLIPKGKHHTKAARKKIAKAQEGRKNSNYKDGGRIDYRKKLGLRKGSNTVVHHKDGNRRNNRKSNLVALPRSKHDKIHKRHKNFKK